MVVIPRILRRGRSKLENGDLSQVRRLEELIMYPRETIDIEIKPWLDLNSNEDKANLAQAVLALANHGGGFVILGFQEKDNTWKPDEERPNDFKFYNQDIVNGIIQSYAEPPFHCELHLVKHRNLGVFPVIIVPGGHKVPIRSKRDGPEKKHVKQNTYYIRRPGPKSEPPQTGREWDELINRCVRANKEQMVNQFREIIYGINSVQTEKTELDTSLQIFREFIEQAKERWQSLVESELANEYPNRYSRGVWTAAYQIIGDIQSIPLPQFKAVLDQVKGNETGWPPWWVPTRREIAPYVFNELIECWLKDTYSVDGAHSDFWRASPSGLMFLLRGYQEDSEAKGVEPGTIFDLTLPVWRTGECLLHAERLSRTIASDQQTLVRFQTTWTGLKGRVLKSWANPRRHLAGDRIARQDTLTSEIVVQADSISTSLPEIVQSITKPLYALFDFFDPPMEMFHDELSRMKSGRE